MQVTEQRDGKPGDGQQWAVVEVRPAVDEEALEQDRLRTHVESPAEEGARLLVVEVGTEPGVREQLPRPAPGEQQQEDGGPAERDRPGGCARRPGRRAGAGSAATSGLPVPPSRQCRGGQPTAMVTPRDTAANRPRPWSHSKRTGQPASGHGRSVRTTRTTTTPITARMPIVTNPARRGRPRADDEHGGGDGGDQRPARPDEQPGEHDPDAGWPPSAPASGPGRSPTAKRAGGTVARTVRRRSTTTRTMQPRTGDDAEHEGDRQRRLRGPADGDVDRAVAGRDPPPVEPAVDELRRAEVAVRRRRRPGVVEALAEHEPAAVRAPVDGDVAARPARRPDRRPSAPSRCRRRRAGSRVGEHDPVDVQPGRRAGRRRQAMACRRRASVRRASHGVAVTASPARRSATAASMRTGSGWPSTVTRSSRHPVSSRSGTTVRRADGRPRRWRRAARPARRSGGRARPAARST